ncbi:hypothetical protein EPA93_15200 [Ktedonosporobacter rubrisoli]|uniref:Uncharacterized protein n=1 Tax=Ktedonosporobacter rubrisoli TaxID=2509675 RepID=A0A4P6JR58_KTERU|nr:hypothetical protein [Ktedonosporobacter rubrisoli]QBD77266.1 hypothetical protein EPA93_15200 [Ktedonosporobacter rubrisoli]
MEKASCTEQLERAEHGDTLQTESPYATQLIPVASSIFSFLCEDELHAAFSNALSERLRAQCNQLYSLAHLLPSLLQTRSALNMFFDEQYPPLNGNATVLPQETSSQILLIQQRWRKWLIYCGLALICMLIGFDIFGLLILYGR